MFPKRKRMCINPKCLEGKSVKVLLQELLSKTLQNAKDHLEDFTHINDPESIHQYRVNIRMARSVCKEFKAFLTPKRTLFLLDYLKSLQKETNALRDIDVFLECIEAYKLKVPQTCLDMCLLIEQSLQNERQKALLALFSKTHGIQRKHLFKELLALIYDDKLYRSKSDECFCKPIQQIIQKRLKRIAKLSSNLSLAAPNEQFHQLRLEYKKIRYTTDCACFGAKDDSLSDFADMFKPLQSALGEVQDKTTQLEHLRKHRFHDDQCLVHVITMIEEGLKLDKAVCIEKSSPKAVKSIMKTFKTLLSKG